MTRPQPDRAVGRAQRPTSGEPPRAQRTAQPGHLNTPERNDTSTPPASAPTVSTLPPCSSTALPADSGKRWNGRAVPNRTCSRCRRTRRGATPQGRPKIMLATIDADLPHVLTAEVVQQHGHAASNVHRAQSTSPPPPQGPGTRLTSTTMAPARNHPKTPSRPRHRHCRRRGHRGQDHDQRSRSR